MNDGSMAMNKKTIDEHLKDFYAEKTMRAESVEAMKSILSRKPSAESKDDERIKPGIYELVAGYFSFRRLSLAFAMICICVITGYLTWNYGRIVQDSKQLHELSQAIGREIAMNHNKDLPVEYTAAEVSTFRSLMPRLDFKPISPKILKNQGLSIIGARYCSIQGNLAIQIKLIAPNGKRYTLYQTAHADPLIRVPDSEFEINGLGIWLWTEKGVFLGMARSAE